MQVVISKERPGLTSYASAPPVIMFLCRCGPGIWSQDGIIRSILSLTFYRMISQNIY